MTDLTRRQVLALGLGGLTAGSAATVLAPTPRSTGLPTWTFHDARFAEARRLASALPGADTVQAIGADMTHLLGFLHPDRLRDGGFRLQGVTTETVPFCLEHALPRHAGLRVESVRLDRDLFAWSLVIPGQASA